MQAWAGEAATWAGSVLVSIIASVQASLVAGILALIALVYCGYHRGQEGRVITGRVIAVLVQSVAFYTFLVCFALHFFAGIPISSVIRDHFGDERLAWLYFPVLIDFGLRVWNEFSDA